MFTHQFSIKAPMLLLCLGCSSWPVPFVTIILRKLTSMIVTLSISPTRNWVGDGYRTDSLPPLLSSSSQPTFRHEPNSVSTGGGQQLLYRFIALQRVYFTTDNELLLISQAQATNTRATANTDSTNPRYAGPLLPPTRLSARCTPDLLSWPYLSPCRSSPW
jgi:hypothetical protein